MPKQTSLARKLALSVALPLLAGTLIISGTSAWRGIEQFTATKNSEVEAVATVFGSTVADDLEVGNRNAALKSLRAIARMPDVRFVQVVDLSGEAWLSLGDSFVLGSGQEEQGITRLTSLMRGRPMVISKEIIKSGAPIGTIKMIIDTSEMRDYLVWALWQTLLLAASVTAIALTVSLRLQRTMLKPIKNLTATMNTVRAKHEFDAHVRRESNDETGQLVDAFNDMLSNIRSRDQELRDHRDHLEVKVEERTRDLKTAKDAAEAATRAKSDFLATMSHEIRTPMNGMMVMSEILAGAELAPRHQRHAELVLKSGKNLLAIVNDILDFSKIESGGLTLEEGEVDLRQITDDVLQLFWQQARSKDLDLGALVDPAVPAIVAGDPVRVTQVLSNLVNNAIKFTAAGHVYVHVDSHNNGQGIRINVTDTGIGISQDGVEKIFETFTQADQSTTRRFGGTGLGLSICRRLVEAMGGAIKVESTPGAGTTFTAELPVTNDARAAQDLTSGVGKSALIVLPDTLSRTVLRKSMEVRGLDVICEEPGDVSGTDIEGRDFIFTTSAVLEGLPDQPTDCLAIIISEIGDFSGETLFAQGRAHDMISRPLTTAGCNPVIDRVLAGKPQGKSALVAGSQDVRQHPSFAGLSILVADDSAVNREVIAQALHQLDVVPEIVDNGAQAIAHIRRKEFDIIFMDASMPDIDGFKVTKLARAFEEKNGREPTPIIALTAHSLDQLGDRCVEAGMNGHLLKPFTLASLAQAMSAWCTQQDGEQTAPPSPDLEVQLDIESLPVIDHEVLNNLKEIAGDRGSDLLKQLYTIFGEHAPGAMETLALSIEAGKRKSIASDAHTLKSMCSNIACARLAARLEAIEDAAGRRDSIDNIKILTRKATDDLAEAISELDDLFGSLASNESAVPSTGQRIVQ